MCGFVALIGKNESDQKIALVRKMLSAIDHRGPDDDGLLDTPVATLGFRRLSILDLSSSGHQPMTSQCGRYSIVFNGEIYNYVELREELEKFGHTFLSRSDTEVLLQAYIRWGESFLKKLNGMWAFLIIDQTTNQIFGSRDRFGIKPLYWHRTEEGSLIIASEIKSIQASRLYKFKPNLKACADYLIENKLDHLPQTFFRDIYRFGAAQAFSITSDGRIQTWQYWDFDHIETPLNTDPAEAFASLFENAIELQMRSDVPCGIHLSGGLDSSSIACESARIRSRLGARDPLVTFSFMDDEFDETEYILATLKQTAAKHHILRTNADSVLKDLSKTIRSQDEPIHSLTPVIGYQLMQLTAEQGIRVVLNGQGADETLGGYGSYFQDAWMTELSKSLPAAWREVQKYASATGQRGQRIFLSLIRHAIKSRMRRLEAYRAIADKKYRNEQRREAWISNELIHFSSGRMDYRASDLDTQLKSSVTSSPLPLYLRTEDRNSMAHSVEARVPFLDHRLVELAFSLERHWKIDADLNKVILRKAMLNRIPNSVQERREKMGFPTPMSRWMKTEYQIPLAKLLKDNESLTTQFFSSKKVLQMLEMHRNGAIGLEGKIFRAITLGIWLRQSQECIR